MRRMRRLPLRREFVLERSAPFSYECGGCSRCCRGKVIPLTPYEVARIAEHLGTTTTEALERWTTRGGSALAARADGACVFLGEQGCSVHPARPLACRLYPLGRSIAPDGTERFAENRASSRDGRGLRRGGHGGRLPRRARRPAPPRGGRSLPRRSAEDARRHRSPPRRFRRARPGVAGARARPIASDESLLDMDALVERWCREHGVEVPRDVEAKMDLHVRALEEHLNRLEP